MKGAPISKPILVTGCAGFIGFHLCRRLLGSGTRVVGIDSVTSYYSPKLKWDRLSILDKLGLEFHQADLASPQTCPQLFEKHEFQTVVHLAAQAGVRYSKENPRAYTAANIEAFLSILEACRHASVCHLIYASSSSVYGTNQKLPYSTDDRTDHPVSLYGATKKANEVMAHSYSWLYGLPVTGLRFFTVYGPWGRPDMAILAFAESILEGRLLQLFNYGEMLRDFTYIDDVVESLIRLLPMAPQASEGQAPARLLNVGNSDPVDLRTFLQTIERALGVDARVELLPLQAGDVLSTAADTSELEKLVGFRPNTPLNVGVKQTMDWYVDYRQSDDSSSTRKT